MYKICLILTGLLIQSTTIASDAHTEIKQKVDIVLTPVENIGNYNNALKYIQENRKHMSETECDRLWKADILEQVIAFKTGLGVIDKDWWQELTKYNPCFELIGFREKLELYKNDFANYNYGVQTKLFPALKDLLKKYEQDFYLWHHAACQRLKDKYDRFNQKIIAIDGSIASASSRLSNPMPETPGAHLALDIKTLLDPEVNQYLRRSPSTQKTLWNRNFLTAAAIIKKSDPTQWPHLVEKMKNLNPSFGLLAAQEALEKDDLDAAK